MWSRARVHARRKILCPIFSDSFEAPPATVMMWFALIHARVGASFKRAPNEPVFRLFCAPTQLCRSHSSTDRYAGNHRENGRAAGIRTSSRERCERRQVFEKPVARSVRGRDAASGRSAGLRTMCTVRSARTRRRTAQTVARSAKWRPAMPADFRHVLARKRRRSLTVAILAGINL